MKKVRIPVNKWPLGKLPVIAINPQIEVTSVTINLKIFSGKYNNTFAC